VLFVPGEVVVVVDTLEARRPQQACHTVADPVASGIGILAGQGHSPNILLAQVAR
jgi:hypothetical protein